jgi:hypothetical protein
VGELVSFQLFLRHFPFPRVKPFLSFFFSFPPVAFILPKRKQRSLKAYRNSNGERRKSNPRESVVK